MASLQSDADLVMNGNSPYPCGREHDFAAIRLFDFFGKVASVLAGVALVAIAVIMCYEISARYIFNSPTAWATEISTYLLVALVFFGLAAAQQHNIHVQVELWVDRLTPQRRITVELVGHWLGFLLVVITAWQAISFNVREYINDTRDWGLLSTPQWIPELSVSIGLAIFALSILTDLYRLRPPREIWRRWFVPVGLILLSVALFGFGRNLLPLFGNRLDWGSVVIVGFTLLGAWAWSSWRIALAVFAAIAGFGLLFWASYGHSLVVVGLLLVVAMFALLMFGVRIALALGLTGAFGVYFLLPRPQLSLLAERAWTSANTFTLSAVPMFIFMGALLLRSGIVTGMFDALVKWFGRTPAGLAHASAGASAVFAAVSGSSLATAATLGKVACPEMIKRGYSPRLTYGVTAAGATLGVLIPPSIPMIIYGTSVGASVTHLFIGGIIPGLLLMFAFMIMALSWAVLVKGSAPTAHAYSLSEKIKGSKGILPFAFIIVAVLGSMYAGIATPTESAALGAVGALILCLARRQMSWADLVQIAMDTSRVTAMLLFIVVGASVFSWVVDYLRIPRELVTVIGQAGLEPWLIVAAMVGAYIVLGMFVESIAMMLMTLPVTFPIAVSLGMDPIWFGVFLVLMIEIGLITPPLGMVLFILRSMDPQTKFMDIITGALPFVVLMIAYVVMLYLFPQIILWLPQQLG